MNRRLLFLLVIVLLAGCAQHYPTDVDSPSGFLYGLFHGLIICFSFIGSLFWDIEIYAFPNAGSWYDFGFVLGASMMLGGSSRSGRRKKRDEMLL